MNSRKSGGNSRKVWGFSSWNQREPRTTYYDSIMGFGLYENSYFLLVVVFILMLIFDHIFGLPVIIGMFLLGIPLILAGHVLYNFLPSPFEKDRKVLYSTFGIVSISKSIPRIHFSRFFIYADGVELRAMYNRYFLPYSAIENFPEESDLNDRILLLKTDLSKVPKILRFSSNEFFEIEKAFSVSRNAYTQNRSIDRENLVSLNDDLPNSGEYELSERNFTANTKTAPAIYTDSLFPMGIHGNFYCALGIFYILLHISGIIASIDSFLEILLLIIPFPLTFAAHHIYNLIESKVEKRGTLLYRFSGKTSETMYDRGLPLSKLLVHKDGVEIRAMFTRYFIPYERINNATKKEELAIKGFLFKLDGPDLPESIFFKTKRYGEMIDRIFETRDKYRAGFF